MSNGPLDRVWELLAPEVREIAERDTPIPTIAQKAAQIARDEPGFVRADIGQISGFDADLELLYGPPSGMPELRAALAEMWSREFALDPALSADNVAICTGAAEGLTLLLRCLASGKTVGLPRGYWENYVNGVALAGGRSVLVDFFDGEGRLDADALRDQLKLYEVDLLLCNFPSNPTGAVLSAQEAKTLTGILRELDLVAIADEVYARLRFDGQPPVSLLGFAPERVVVVSSASKEYLIPGARVGYVLSARKELTAIILRKMIRANTASPNLLGQRLLLERLSGDLEDMRAGRPPRLLGRVREELSRRRLALVGVLREHGFPLVGRTGREPIGTIFLMTGVPDWFDGDEHAFAERALRDAVVSVVPGGSFGLPGALRFSYGGMTEEMIGKLDAGLRRMRNASRGAGAA